MRIVMLGPPGAGKGTQADQISSVTGLPTISTGHILRRAVKKGVPVGLKAKAYMDAGKLVPDDIIIEAVKGFLEKEENKMGCILDGMPRTLPQAEKLEEMGVEIDVVVLIELSDADIEKRMSGRQACPDCGTAYNLNSQPPQKAGVCDKCGGLLERRGDDEPEMIRERLKVYHKETEPIIEFYKSRDKIKAFDGSLDIKTTTKLILEAIGLSK